MGIVPQLRGPRTDQRKSLFECDQSEGEDETVVGVGSGGPRSVEEFPLVYCWPTRSSALGGKCGFAQTRGKVRGRWDRKGNGGHLSVDMWTVRSESDRQPRGLESPSCRAKFVFKVVRPTRAHCALQPTKSLQLE
jgi:hypothetical protein